MSVLFFVGEVNLTGWKALCPRVSPCPIGQKRSDGLEAVNSVVLGAKHMKSLIKRFANDESGATAIEYGLIAGLLSIVIVGALAATGTSLSSIFTKIQTQLSTADGKVS